MSEGINLKKLGPPLVLLLIGMCFWWFEANPTQPRKSGESVPSKILTTWKSGDRRLTLYEASTGEGVDGFFFNPKSNLIHLMVKGRYRDTALRGLLVSIKIK